MARPAPRAGRTAFDKQAILDHIIEALHAQRGPALQHNGCYYRTSDGRKSPLGSLIGDDHYAADLEDRDPAILPPAIFAALGVGCQSDSDFLVAIEIAHDVAAWRSHTTNSPFWLELHRALQPIATHHAVSLAKLHELGLPPVAVPEARPPITIARLGQPALICPRQEDV